MAPAHRHRPGSPAGNDGYTYLLFLQPIQQTHACSLSAAAQHKFISNPLGVSMTILFVAWQHQTQQDDGIQLTPPGMRPSVTIPSVCGARAWLASSNMTFVFIWEIKLAAGHAVLAGELIAHPAVQC
jgi:hypothetical protein